MKNTFGSNLLQFSKTVDILEADNFNKIQQHVETYLARVLQIKYVRLMLVHEMLGGQLMLQKYVLNKKEEKLLLLKDIEGNYNGQMAYAFEENRELWITAKENISLNDCEGEYLDHWGKQTQLPIYRQFDTREKVKTSIIIPIKKDNNRNDNKHIFGVVNFESKEHLPMTKNAQKELKNISYALGNLFQLHEGHNFQGNNTLSIIDGYKEVIDSFNKKDKEYFFKKKPSIFFAFSKKSDKEVTGIIKQVIQDSFAKELSIITRDDHSNVDSINSELLEKMSNIDYFICYLSEKEKEELKYKDNPNFLIELGFFIGKNRGYKDCSNIIIIREEDSNKPLPFDIEDILTLNVSRLKTKDKGLNSDLFIDNLNGKIKRAIISCKF